MQNPFEALGVVYGASPEQVRAAYHARVKLCHPDCMQDEAERLNAQEELVRLNLAYAEALKQATHRKAHAVALPDARLVAERLYREGHMDSALRMLGKAPVRDAAWFCLQGNILLKKGEAEAAHASFRTAVRLNPENASYRELALSAAVQMRKQKTLRGKMGHWARNMVGKML